MGRVCKRVKDSKASLKSELAKRDYYTRYLGHVDVMVKGRGEVVERVVVDEIQAICSPVRFMNAVPLRRELCRTPKTPCKMQGNNMIGGSPKTPCGQGKISDSPRVLANLLRTPKTPCSKSRFQNSPSAAKNLLKTPKTPCSQESLYDSRLESLPIDILVKVLCHLHHDQLKPAFHVSKRVREAVQLARQFHFNFTTPDRTRQALLNTTTPQPWEHWPFIKNRNGMLKQCPKTPKAPRHSSRPPPKFDSSEVCPIDDALFQESLFPSRCASTSSLSRSISKSQLASNRVLFYNNDSNCCNSLL